MPSETRHTRSHLRVVSSPTVRRVEEDPRVEEQLHRIDGLRGGKTDRVVLIAEVRKLLAEAEAALAAREGDPAGAKNPPESPHDAA